MTDTPDLLVIGLGAVGSATLLHAAGQGAEVLGIDRYAPPHAHGSTHGESRITRLAIGEGAEYVPLVRRSHKLWRELEAASGQSMYRACGGLVLARRGLASPMHGQASFFDNTVAVARVHGIGHEVLDAAAIAARWPQFGLTGDELGYFEPEAGYLRPEACVAAQLALARQRGARVQTGERLLGWRVDARGLRVDTDRATYRPGQAVLAVGAWLLGLLGAAAPPLRVTRQVLHWFEADAPMDYAETRFPIFIWNWGAGADEVFYGFPDLGGGVKVATEQDAPCDPDRVERDVAATESATLHARHVAGRLRGVSARVRQAATCLYTEAPGARFLVDRLEEGGPILASACSGHGFKHSAALGEALAAWALSGERPACLAPFAASGLAGD
ncbi:MAG: N-methyl-L-tryptophan oxidase [Xanthomonadales bacterium]|nr:N-methyl-L-tryptophan oxidase [Xanthomonadales bacterium]